MVHGMMGWGMGIGWFTMIFFWGIIIAGIVLMVKWISVQGQSHPKQSSDSAMDILERKYANSEITEKEFKTMKKNLRGG